MKESLSDIAKRLGWKYEQREGNVYDFRKGPLRVRFNRAGLGQLTVECHGVATHWGRAFEVDGKTVTIVGTTREQYAATLLPLVTHETASAMAKNALLSVREACAKRLREANERLERFAESEAKYLIHKGDPS